MDSKINKDLCSDCLSKREHNEDLPIFGKVKVCTGLLKNYKHRHCVAGIGCVEPGVYFVMPECLGAIFIGPDNQQYIRSFLKLPTGDIEVDIPPQVKRSTWEELSKRPHIPLGSCGLPEPRPILLTKSDSFLKKWFTKLQKSWRGEK